MFVPDEVPNILAQSSRARYFHLRDRWRGRTVSHISWWLFHNLIAHPLLGVCPTPGAIRIHDWSSGKLARKKPRASKPPKIRRPLRWAFHNVVVHAAIGLVPCRRTFRWHDKTAKKMDVPDWV